jgi:hypothetical protein
MTDAIIELSSEQSYERLQSGALRAVGGRSLQCARSLQSRGYTRLFSIAGGTTRWKAAGLPMTEPTADADFLERYSRHLWLSEVGLDGQRKLAAARVALIGAGGLGSPAALYLATAGIGHITLIDDDLVDRSNLQREVLHRDADIGTPKVESGCRTLAASGNVRGCWRVMSSACWAATMS